MSIREMAETRVLVCVIMASVHYAQIAPLSQQKNTTLMLDKYQLIFTEMHN